MSAKLESLVSISGNPGRTVSMERQASLRSAAPSLLVGEIVETMSARFPGRVSVRWNSIEGEPNQQHLSVVKDLALEKGDRVVLQRPDNSVEWLVTHAIAAASNSPRSKVDARVDGRRIMIEGQDEIVLRCGSASITLRRNGRVVIRGAYVESRSKGTNRIKGGSVLIN